MYFLPMIFKVFETFSINVYRTMAEITEFWGQKLSEQGIKSVFLEITYFHQF